ncbi:protein of unknown function [Burkholderia multivorans]
MHPDDDRAPEAPAHHWLEWDRFHPHDSVHSPMERLAWLTSSYVFSADRIILHTLFCAPLIPLSEFSRPFLFPAMNAFSYALHWLP